MKLSELTTTGVGGPAGNYVRAGSSDAIVAAVRAADQAGEDVLIVGGGSNLVVDDAGYPGTVIHVASRGISFENDDAAPQSALVRVQAGHPWDDVVAKTVARRLSGLEALSGIPGAAGATPVQNVGAYGSDVSQTLESILTWDRVEEDYRDFSAAELVFGYRDSLLKHSTTNGSPRYVVLTVDFRLKTSELSAPVQYAELAKALGVEVGERAPSADVRREVLRLRASKGMVLDPEDRDTYSTGSFFTNPIVSQAVIDQLPEDAPRYPTLNPNEFKTSAAWLIDRAGFGKGYGLEGTEGFPITQGRASLSTKHTLALTNRGAASSYDIVNLAQAVRAGVEAKFGIVLHNEPLLINTSLD
ncbi:UDP-N-acetylmuramate dehydrogenase [Neomicrococcus aestuarii]|uniref:UDP-N-acetylenolpyruvoylglucosamine reductase n=1 Tax=Neomicrococcus aestuarii TaxID=556325 RepID=A0A7W8TWZ6_9MICC|nr:UDP-N-acetylmuramate dehydrogenase [Neomicrococcus aestuarii]MBB5513508.1 UDP-N-acetylmuramate dehydrogenase [Neomicrococcus aestuarii]